MIDPTGEAQVEQARIARIAAERAAGTYVDKRAEFDKLRFLRDTGRSLTHLPNPLHAKVVITTADRKTKRDPNGKTGPNSLCPCLSGEKLKYCCDARFDVDEAMTAHNEWMAQHGR